MTCLLTQLKILEIRFGYWTHDVSHVSSPLPSTAPDHGVLPFPTEFRFKGACEYIVARLDIPFLQKGEMEFFDRPSFGIQHLRDFSSGGEALIRLKLGNHIVSTRV